MMTTDKALKYVESMVHEIRRGQRPTFSKEEIDEMLKHMSYARERLREVDGESR